MVHVPLVSPFVYLLESLLHQTLKLALFFSLLFAGLHRLGVIQRAIHRFAEVELSKVSEIDHSASCFQLVVLDSNFELCSPWPYLHELDLDLDSLVKSQLHQSY